ncbi:MAG TPA: 4-hydroxy-tetrahydrodipicolinate synthase, partial [Clostridiales bacterium]|nr:4-hydroxy-tetrahydrodipicolinate synthase [Clostridiales bacterium]
NIQPQTYAELCKHPNIVATKEANNDIAALCKTVSLCGDDLIIYSGNDDQIVPILSMGGMGVISVLANIMPKETHQLTQTFFDGDVTGAAKMQANLMGIVSALFCDVNPVPVKQALNLMGKNVGPCRLPLVEMSDAGLAQLKGELKKWNLI